VPTSSHLQVSLACPLFLQRIPRQNLCKIATLVGTTTYIQNILNHCCAVSGSLGRKVAGLNRSLRESAVACVGGDLCRKEVGLGRATLYGHAPSTSHKQHLLSVCVLVNPTSVIASSLRHCCEDSLPSVTQMVLSDEVICALSLKAMALWKSL